MSELTTLMKTSERTPAARRSKLVAAVSYSRAVKLLSEADHVTADDLDLLRRDADAEIQSAVKGCVLMAKTPAEVRETADRRREGSASPA